ncbi:MAG: hypothetical protein U0228_16445 [Myxococcaceae bacterium]
MTRWAATLAWLALAGCATGHIPRVPGDPPPAVADAEAERNYQSVLERYTSERAVYDNLDTKIFFRATWLSRTFAEARVRREGMFKAWPTSELDAKWTAEQDRLKGVTEFFFAVHANDYRFDDFEKTNSMWRMVLVVNGEELPPATVERLGRTNTEMRSYFSYMESFWVGYRVRFAREVGGERFTLKLASALGKAELEYGESARQP